MLSSNLKHADLFRTRLWFLEASHLRSYHDVWRNQILSLQKISPSGEKKSNVNGWQSQATLLSDPVFEPLANSLKDYFVAALKEMIGDRELKFSVQAWANVNQNNSLNIPHYHPLALLSAVYYLSVPESSGDIYFRDPRPGARLSFFFGNYGDAPNCSSDVRVRPKEGLFLVFPGWLEHGVHLHQGYGERISISANASLPTETVNQQ